MNELLHGNQSSECQGIGKTGQLKKDGAPEGDNSAARERLEIQEKEAAVCAALDSFARSTQKTKETIDRKIAEIRAAKAKKSSIDE